MAKAGGLGSALGVARLWRATRHSAQGLAATFRHEAAFRQELAAAALLIPLALALALLSAISWTQCALLVSLVICAMVWVLVLLDTFA